MNGNYDIAIIVTSSEVMNIESKELTAYLKQAMVETEIYK